MTLVLLDTNAYLRLAKRIWPLLGMAFGQKHYVLTVLQDVEHEVHSNRTLNFRFSWFDDEELGQERDAAHVPLTDSQIIAPRNAQSVRHGYVLAEVDRCTTGRRHPPSPTDCHPA